MIASVGILLTFVLRVARRLDEAGIGRIAASLSFTTLLGLVPLFTVAFAYVARYSAFQSWVDGLEPFLLRYLLPGSSNTVRRYLAEFTTNTANLKGFAIGFVVLTAVLLVAEVEREINVIWGIETPRSFMRRVVVYSLGLVAVPILIGGTAYATSWLIVQSIAAVPLAGDALTLLATPVALAVGTVVLTLVYKFVPATPVRWSAALLGGLFTAVVFEAAKMGFAFYIRRFPTYQLVYGALATIPLLLLWIYLAWIILLAGAAVTATLSERRAGGRKSRRSR